MTSTVATVVLVDGRVVPSDSEEWKLECLARFVLAKPFDERAPWLDVFDERHGAGASQPLRAAIINVHRETSR